VFKFPEDIIQVHRHIEKLPRFQEFMDAKERGSINGNIGYKTSLVYLQQFVTTNHSGLNIDSIIDPINSGTIDVYKFLDKFVTFLQTKKSWLSKASTKQYVNYIKSYLQYHDVDIVPHKFKKRVMLPKIPQEDAQPIDESDIRTILTQCHNRRLKTILLIYASSGVRPIEACALRVCDINFNSTPVRIHIRAEYTKTKKSRDIYISDEAASWLKEWIEDRFRIILNKSEKIDRRISESLVFQVFDIDNYVTTPQSIYKKLVPQFHKVLTDVNLDRRKDGMPQNRTISLNSFRRFVKTTISIQANSDYSEWILGHKHSSYWTVKPETRAEIYTNKCMKYLTFLDYSTLEATGRSTEARINELEKEKKIMEQKHEEQINSMQLQVNRIREMIQYNPKLARLKQTALTRLAKK
jgi:integrase